MRAPSLAFVAAAVLVAACGARTSLPSGVGDASLVADGPPADASVSPPARRTLSMSWDHACAITADERVACWGDNSLGAVGPSAPLRAPPTLVDGIAGVQEIATGQLLTCALRADQSTWCWGNFVGSATPIALSAFPPASRLFVGAAEVCVVTDAGAVACAGLPLYGTTCPLSSTKPVFAAVQTIALPGPATELALGHRHVCARLASGEVDCWGCDPYGALGSPSTTSSPLPTRIDGVTAAHLASETHAVCATDLAGAVRCWGEGSQFGTSLTVAPTTVIPVALGDAAHDFDVGVVTSCAALPGRVFCNGALYDFTKSCNDRTVGTLSLPLADVREVSVGYMDACARDGSGDVWCWGCNQLGADGDAPGKLHATPFRVPL